MSNVLVIAYPERAEYPAQARRRLDSWTADLPSLLAFVPPRSNLPKAAARRLRLFGTTLGADVTGLSTLALVAGAEPNFIGLYTTSSYPRVFPFLSADMPTPVVILEANPHFIGKFHKAF